MTGYDLVPCNLHVSAIAYGDQKITQLPRIALSGFLKSGNMHPYDDFALPFRPTQACKVALGKIADKKKVSIAWVIRDTITKHLSEEPKKSQA
jgi:hypothetical protein